MSPSRTWRSITELAKRMGLGKFFDKSEEEYIEMLLSSGHPSLEGITLEKLKKGPMKPKPYPAPPLSHPLRQDGVLRGEDEAVRPGTARLHRALGELPPAARHRSTLSTL